MRGYVVGLTVHAKKKTARGLDSIISIVSMIGAGGGLGFRTKGETEPQA